MASTQNEFSQKDISRVSPIVLPVLIVCAVAVAICMGFGNQFLWATTGQDGSAVPPVGSSSQDGSEGIPGSSEETPQANIDTTNMKIMSEHTAVSQSEDADRAKNLAYAAEVLNQVVIAPGEEISFNEIIGNTENDEHYAIAPVTSGSAVSESKRGGGICQVSTAVYLAALYADMEVVERHPHSVAVDYASIGLDAVVVYGEKDLRLKNNSEYPMMIEAKASGQSVTVAFFGTPRESDAAVEISSKVMDSVFAEDVWTSDDQEAYYYTVEAYRNYVVNGEKSNSVMLSSDTYVVYKPAQTSISSGYDPKK